MIRVEGLAIRRGDSTVIRDYDFLIERGSTVAILGSNGVGKTSLINVIAGLLRQSEGKVTRDAQVGYVPQLFDVAFDYSVIDIVLMGRARHIGLFGSPRAADYQAAHLSMQRLGIEHLAERSFNTLSGGQRQLAIIAQALTSECDLLILDEPCSALDYRNQATVIAMLDRLRVEHGLTILFTSHSPQHALEIATHVLLDVRRPGLRLRHRRGIVERGQSEQALRRSGQAGRLLRRKQAYVRASLWLARAGSCLNGLTQQISKAIFYSSRCSPKRKRGPNGPLFNWRCRAPPTARRSTDWRASDRRLRRRRPCGVRRGSARRARWRCAGSQSSCRRCRPGSAGRR